MTDLLDLMHVVYLKSEGDYWTNKEEFCNNFEKVPLTDDVVIYVYPDGLSLTYTMAVPVIEKIIEETGRDPETVYVFNSNKLINDTCWKNLYFENNVVNLEFIKSRAHLRHTRPRLAEDFKTWGLFLEQKTTPGLLTLYDIFHNTDLKQKCFLGATEYNPEPLIVDRPEMFDDQLSEWMPIDNKIQKTLKHYNFREFCSKLPVPLVDTTKITDMINLSSQYLFEVVFETITRGFAFTPGKKTAKTIVVDKPFIAYAPKNFLKNLREDLGFQTFEDLWDESYDQLEGIQRQAAMMSLIQQIGALPKTQQLELYENSRKICAYNRKILRNL